MLNVTAITAWLFPRGHAVDVMLLVLVAEAAWLITRRRSAALPGLLPAVPILLALRVALTGGGWPWVAGWLMLSLPVHLYDLKRRLTSGSSDRR